MSHEGVFAGRNGASSAVVDCFEAGARLGSTKCASGDSANAANGPERAYLKGIERLTRQPIEMVPLPANFINEANRIKATRTSAPEPSREERREEERGQRRFPPRANRGQGRYASRVKPMGDGRRRAAGR